MTPWERKTMTRIRHIKRITGLTIIGNAPVCKSPAYTSAHLDSPKSLRSCQNTHRCFLRSEIKTQRELETWVPRSRTAVALAPTTAPLSLVWSSSTLSDHLPPTESHLPAEILGSHLTPAWILITLTADRFVNSLGSLKLIWTTWVQ